MLDNSLTDRLAIEALMINYANGIDERDKAMYGSCFADDVEIHGFGELTFTGRDSWLDHVWQMLSNFASTQHLLGPIRIDINGDRASTRTDVQATHVIANSVAHQLFILWATYKSQLQRTASGWQITRHELIVRASKNL